MFTGGNLVDRDLRPEDAIEGLEQRRIASVRGNYEQMMVNTLVLDGGLLHSSGTSRTCNQCRGWWWYEAWFNQPFEKNHSSDWALERRCARWLNPLQDVWLLLTLKTPASRVGAVHTLELAVSCMQLKATIETLAESRADPENDHPYYATHDLPEETLWHRPTVERSDLRDTTVPEAIGNIALSMTGPTPGAETRWTRPNVLRIDIGLDSDKFSQLAIADIDNGSTILYQTSRIEPNLQRKSTLPLKRNTPCVLLRAVRKSALLKPHRYGHPSRNRKSPCSRPQP